RDWLGGKVAGLSHRSPAIQMLDDGLVAPGDTRSRLRLNAPAIRSRSWGARRPPVQHNGLDPFPVHAWALGKLCGIDSKLGAESLATGDCVCHHDSPPAGRHLTMRT